MGVQSPGLTHPSQMFGTPVPTCRPSAFRPSDFEHPQVAPQGLGTPAMGCQQWGQPGKGLKASHGKMGVAPSITGSSELGRCHLSAGCEDTETSVPQAGHVVSLSPPTWGSAHRRSHPVRAPLRG